MQYLKKEVIIPVVAGVIVSAIATGAIVNYTMASQLDVANKTIQTLQGQVKDLSNEISTPTPVAKVEKANPYDTGAVIDEETGIKENDYPYFNAVMTDVVPRICKDQEIKKLHQDDNGICLLYQISQKDGNPTETLKKYLDSL